MIKAIRGTRDLLPPDTDLWNRVDAKVRDVFARYNYHEIRTPVFEDTSLFSRSVGEEQQQTILRYARNYLDYKETYLAETKK